MPGLMPGDLIEIDMDAVDGEGVIHLSNADYLTRPLRLTADEALALVLALRTLREVVGRSRPAGDRQCPGQARGGDRQRHPGGPGERHRHRRPRGDPGPDRRSAAAAQAARPDLRRGLPGRDDPADGRPAAGVRAGGVRLSRRLVPFGGRSADVPAGPDRRGRGDRARRRSASGRGAQGFSRSAGSTHSRTHRWSPWSCCPGRPGSPSTTRRNRWCPGTAAVRPSRSGSPIRPGCAACCSGWAAEPGWWRRETPAVRRWRRPRRRWTSTKLCSSDPCAHDHPAVTRSDWSSRLSKEP